jgi:hypothetical protein
MAVGKLTPPGPTREPDDDGWEIFDQHSDKKTGWQLVWGQSELLAKVARRPVDIAKPRLLKTGFVRFSGLASLDGRTRSAREARQRVVDLESDLGGGDRLSVGQRELMQRIAVIGAQLADFEARWLAGELIEFDAYLAACNVQRRLLVALGLERKARDVSPGLGALLVEDRVRDRA